MVSWTQYINALAQSVPCGRGEAAEDGIGFSWGASIVWFCFLSPLLLFCLEGLACLCFFTFMNHSVLKILEVQFENLEVRV